MYKRLLQDLLYILNIYGDSTEVQVYNDNTLREREGNDGTNSGTVSTGTINLDTSKKIDYIRFYSSGRVGKGGNTKADSWVSKFVVNL